MHLPVVNFNAGIAERLASLSEPYGVGLEKVDGVIRCNW